MLYTFSNLIIFWLGSAALSLFLNAVLVFMGIRKRGLFNNYIEAVAAAAKRHGLIYEPYRAKMTSPKLKQSIEVSEVWARPNILAVTIQSLLLGPLNVLWILVNIATLTKHPKPEQLPEVSSPEFAKKVQELADPGCPKQTVMEAVKLLALMGIFDLEEQNDIASFIHGHFQNS